MSFNISARHFGNGRRNQFIDRKFQRSRRRTPSPPPPPTNIFNGAEQQTEDLTKRTPQKRTRTESGCQLEGVPNTAHVVQTIVAQNNCVRDSPQPDPQNYAQNNCLASSTLPEKKAEFKKTQPKEHGYNTFKERLPPPLGQPGGLDDPLRNGLSKYAINRYLKFLYKGVVPIEARRLAQEKFEVKSIRRMAVIPQAYPDEVLNGQDLTLIGDAIVEELAREWNVKPQFDGIKKEPSMLLLDCVNQETVDWLKEVVPKLSEWKGVELMACLSRNVLKTKKIIIFLPNNGGQDNSKTLALIRGQNKGLNTKCWKIVNCREMGNFQEIIFTIDEDSYETIVANDCFINYKFGKVVARQFRAQSDVPNASHSSQGLINPVTGELNVITTAQSFKRIHTSRENVTKQQKRANDKSRYRYQRPQPPPFREQPQQTTKN